MMWSPISARASAALPGKILWAWQRSEDLRTIDPNEFGVAYLACNVLLTGNRLDEHWRDQPLSVPREAKMIPVIRIDSDRRLKPALNDEQINAVARILVKISKLPQTAAVQIDFDAVETERAFYKKLLTTVRPLLPENLPLSITSLASWCLYDNWIKDLPIDEKVPMMFSLGADRQKVLLFFRSHREFLEAGCCKALGLSLEDPEVNNVMIPLALSSKIPVRVYFFTRKPWTDSKIQAVHKLLSKP